jgi:hypothetical protein
MLKSSLLAGAVVLIVSGSSFAQYYSGGGNVVRTYPGADISGYGANAYSGPIRSELGSGGCWVTTHDSRGYGYWGACSTSDQDMDGDRRGDVQPHVEFSSPR